MSTAASQKPTMASHASPVKSANRRVLGDISPKVINTPSKQTNKHHAYDDLRARSPLKQVQTHPPLVYEDKENVNFQAGRKRSIDEVHGAESPVARAGSVFAARDIDMPASKVRVLSETPQDSSINRDVLCDRGSSTEPDTPPADNMNNNTGQSQESNASFSAFVDWAECATQTTQASEQTPVAPTPASKQPSKADLLRLRLGFATYKVRTNQISRPSSEILSSFEDDSSSMPTPRAAGPRPCQAEATVPSITLSSASSPLHVKANLDPGRPIPKLSAAPVLLPTTYSSRTVEYHVPSSPPANTPNHAVSQCISPEEVSSPIKRGPADYRTPAARRIREADYEDEYEDGDDDTADLTIQERLQRQRERGFERGDLTSSVVKGRAAMGLLELGGARR